MDVKLIQRLIKLMKDGELFELELEDDKAGTRLRLKRGKPEAPAAQMPMLHVMHGRTRRGTGRPRPERRRLPAARRPSPRSRPPRRASRSTRRWSAPSTAPPRPSADPFVRVGTRIELNRTLCIIEAMKVMNEIKAEITGELLEILVENGEPVEFGQPLFLVKPD